MFIGIKSLIDVRIDVVVADLGDISLDRALQLIKMQNDKGHRALVLVVNNDKNRGEMNG